MRDCDTGRQARKAPNAGQDSNDLILLRNTRTQHLQPSCTFLEKLSLPIANLCCTSVKNQCNQFN